MSLADTLETSRARRLKAATETAHESVDTRIMAARPFENRQRYGRFLGLQHQFHSAIAPLYACAPLLVLIPDLAERRRLEAVSQDLADLGLPQPAAPHSPFANQVDLPTALGWLYVAEGSNLGAAFLAKAAQALDLSGDFGARHLAAHPEGRGLYWRRFTAALDAVPLTPTEELRAENGAGQAFERVRALITEWLDSADRQPHA